MHHTHQLNNSAHSHIIERTDPITGDKITENDKVVFCGNCSSCFLEESWKYVNYEHCEQNKTLDFIPLVPSKLLVKKDKNSIVFLKKRADTDGVVVLLSFTSLFFGMSPLLLVTSFLPDSILLNESLKGIFVIVSFFGSCGLSFFVSWRFVSSDFFRSIIGFKKHDISIFKNRIKVGKDVFYWQDIEEIKFQRYMNGSKMHIVSSKIPELLIYLKDGTNHVKTLPNSNYKDIEPFLKGLIEIPVFVEVFLYTEEAKEYDTIKKLASRFSKGNINIKEPLKILKDPNYPKQS
ncbi:hypothetical protein WAF17_01800 [Bernardetia sp. ABR2-2B]|uniref:hypothetical protein n=1 Tax=Bernardetia sp. ABR2-2B TaxID=3127472 RepID=UPI0030CD3BB3